MDRRYDEPSRVELEHQEVTRLQAKHWISAGALGAACVAGCGTSPPDAERFRTASSAIQNGATDTSHTFVVGVVQLGTNLVEFCTGSLLAPNLVVTARHCVADISSPQIDCSKATFGSLVADSSLYVTTDTVITQHSGFVQVASGGILVPSGTMVCGNDIALLILSRNITLPSYVVPAITPPLTDPSRSTTVTAIGYGVNTPTDDAGVTAGTRRIKENVGLACIPNDSNFIDCFSDPTARQLLTANEFVSGDMSTCEGDSGSSAFDQAAFNAGSWVSYGVLSRGSTSQDGLTCAQPIYTRLDAWGSLLIQAAQQAAVLGKYAVPSWASGGAGGLSEAGTAVVADGSTGTGSSSGGAGSADASSPATAVVLAADGAPCNNNNVQCANECVSFDNQHDYCASMCGPGRACPNQFTCVGDEQEYCFPSSAVPPHSSGGGCSLGTASRRGPGAPAGSPATLGIVLLAIRASRRLASGTRRAGARLRGRTAPKVSGS
jgi:secreted trypsin-like serine protease